MALKRQVHQQKLEELRQRHRLELDEMVLSQHLELASHETQARLGERSLKTWLPDAWKDMVVVPELAPALTP